MQWTEENLRKQAMALLSTHSIDHSSLKTLRFGENAVFHPVGSGLVLRISRPSVSHQHLTRQIAVSQALKAASISCVTIAGDFPAPVDTPYGLATLWSWQPPDPIRPEISLRRFGTILREFHDAISASGIEMEPWDPFTKIIARIQKAAQEVANSDISSALSSLLTYSADLSSKASSPWPAGETCLHGDAHTGNIIVSGGNYHIHDFDDICHGPTEWDFAPLGVACRRFGVPRKELDDLQAGYGKMVAHGEPFDRMTQIRELFMTTWLLQNRNESNTIQKEVDHRIHCILTGDSRNAWKPN